MTRLERLVNYFFQKKIAILIVMILFFGLASIRLADLKITGQLQGFHSSQDQLFKDAEQFDSIFTNTRNRVFISITPEEKASFDLISTCDLLEDDLRKLNSKVELTSVKPQLLKYYILIDPSHTVPVKSALDYLAVNPKTTKLISRDKKAFLMIASFPDANVPVEALQTTLEKSRKGIKQIHHFGIVPLEATIEKSIIEDIFFIALSVIAFFTLYIFWAYRSISALFFSVLSMGMSILMTVCLFPWLGIQINVLTVLALPVVLVLSLSDAIHILSALSKESDYSRVVQKLIIPSFLSSLTTAIAFFTFFFSDAESIRNLGLITGLAVILEFFVSFALVFLVISRVNVKHKPPVLLSFLTNWIIQKRAFISVILIFVVVGSVFFISSLKFEADTKLFFPDNQQITKDHTFINEQYHVQTTCNIWFKNTKNISQEQFQQAVEEKAAIFTKDKRVIDYSNSSEQNGSATLNKAVDSNLILLELNFKKTADIVAFYNEINQKKQLESSQMEAHVYSQFILFDVINNQLAQTLFYSLLSSGLAIILMLFIITKSIKQALIGFVPNLVPLAIVVWTFYFFDFKLNLLTAMTTVVCIGLLDDDTIHILYRKFVLKQAPESLTYSIMNTAILLAVGFGLFILSNFIPTRIFGGVSALVFVFGILGELTLFQWVLDKIKKDETDE